MLEFIFQSKMELLHEIPHAKDQFLTNKFVSLKYYLSSCSTTNNNGILHTKVCRGNIIHF